MIFFKYFIILCMMISSCCLCNYKIPTIIANEIIYLDLLESEITNTEEFINSNNYKYLNESQKGDLTYILRLANGDIFYEMGESYYKRRYEELQNKKKECLSIIEDAIFAQNNLREIINEMTSWLESNNMHLASWQISIFQIILIQQLILLIHILMLISTTIILNR